MNELIQMTERQIGDDVIQTVNARDLHAFLEVGKVFAAWMQDRIEQYGFVENQDFVCFPILESKGRGGHNRKDYHLTLDMAKELAMVERNDKGKQARLYFIECERRARANWQASIEAVTPMPVSVSHRADHIVSAARCFNGLMRAAASIKLGHARAAMAANQAALRHAGVNILEELGVAPSELAEEARLLLEKDDLAQRVKAWLDAPGQSDKHAFTSQEIMGGVFNIGPVDEEYRSLVTRLGYAMARIGWKKQRASTPGRMNYYQRPG